MIQRRRHPRFRLDAVKLSGQMTASSEVTILDIAMGGVSVAADQRLNIAGKYSLKLELGDAVLPVTCEVAWSRMSGMKRVATGEAVPIYTAGMKFVEVPPGFAETMNDLLDNVGGDPEQPDERREHRRVSARSPGIALIDFPAQYRVRTLSLSGMLIESAATLEPESRVPLALFLGGGEDCDLVGRVVSSRPANRDGTMLYDIGIEFVEMPGMARIGLAVFLASLPEQEEEAALG
jgi:hypothetical protein